MLFKKARLKSEGAIRFFDYGSKTTRILAVVIFLSCLVLLFISLFPVVWLFGAGFMDNAEVKSTASILPVNVDFAKYAATWEQLGFTRYHLNTLIVVGGCVLSAVVFNGMLGFVLGILKPRGHKLVFALVLWTLLIPATTSMVALYVSIARVGLTKSFIPLWLMAGANAFYVVLYKEYFESLPKEFIEAARVEGCTDFQILIKIIMPLSRPIMAVVAIFAVTAAWSDFLMPYLLLNNTEWQTVAVRLYVFNTPAANVTDTAIIRSIVFSIIPPIILFLIFQKMIIRGVQAGGIKE